MSATNQQNKLKSIQGMLSGKDCYIVGSGSSLTGFDFSKLDDKFTLGINHTIEYYDNLKVLEVFLLMRILMI